jgi:hypothetical protein
MNCPTPGRLIGRGVDDGEVERGAGPADRRSHPERRIRPRLDAVVSLLLRGLLARDPAD